MDARELKRDVRRAATGDRAAAGRLFDRYYGRVYRYALAKLANTAAAEDVASETFAAMLSNLGRFRWRGAGFEAWLFRIASNLVVDHVRRSARETAVDEPAELVDEAGPEQAFLASDRQRRLVGLIAELVPDQQEVLYLRFAAGLDTNQVAEILDREPNAVRQLQFRALQNLRALAQEGVEIR